MRGRFAYHVSWLGTFSVLRQQSFQENATFVWPAVDINFRLQVCRGLNELQQPLYLVLHHMLRSTMHSPISSELVISFQIPEHLQNFDQSVIFFA